MKFVMNRNHVVASTLGYSIKFEKDVPQYVPTAMHKEVIAAGGVATDGDEVEFEDKKTDIPVPEGEERVELIKMALLDIQKIADRESFASTGVPKVKAVAAITGFPVTSAEISEAWTALKQAEE